MTTRITRPAALAAATAVAVVALAACSSPSNSSGASGTSGAAPSGGAGRGAGSGGRFGGGVPGASGLIAAIDGNTLQVQSQQLGQVAVTVSAATTYTQTVSTSLSAVKPGVCVTAIAPQSSTPTAPSGSQTRPTSITAGTVSISTPTNGTCGFGGRGRTGAGGFPTDRPSGFPTNRPSGFPTGGFGGNRGFGEVISGLVTAVSGSAISVQENQFTPGSGTTATVNATVTVTSSTKFTTVAPATKAAVKVGKCATAIGPADSTGAVKASRVAISTPSSTGCTGGFGFGRGGTGN